MKTAFVFPGQGSQKVGMLQDLYNAYPIVKQRFEEADDALGYSITKLCFEGPDTELVKTANTQPAILTASIACYEVLKEQGFTPDIVGGHSLGEYSALVAAGVLNFKDAVYVVHKRGQYMQEAVPLGKGAMAAILALPREQVVDAVDVPVIAAGGIADGRGVAAAFALGAHAVQMGTRFVLSEECIAHENYKNAVLKAKDRSTVMTGLTTGHPVRIIDNQLAHKYKNLEFNGGSKEELENLGAGTLRKAAIEGDVKEGSVMIGQIAGMLQDVKPCKDIIVDIMTEAEAVINNLQRFGK